MISKWHSETNKIQASGIMILGETVSALCAARLGGYEQRMLQHARGAIPGMSARLRRHRYRQAERLAA